VHQTKIEWVFNPDGTRPGWVWNPITGCLGPKGDGVRCPYCYARKLANGRLKAKYLANDYIARDHIKLGSHYDKALSDPFYPRFWPERLYDKGLGMCEASFKKRGIFVCDMGELFGDWVPREWQDQIFSVIKANFWHRFYLLTKQPQNLIKFSPFPDNCYVGVTVTEHFSYIDAIKNLRKVKAKVKFLSYEPVLGPLETGSIILSTIDWLIIGCQTNPLKLPKFEWVEETINDADKAGIPVFIKPPLSDIMNYRREEVP